MDALLGDVRCWVPQAEEGRVGGAECGGSLEGHLKHTTWLAAGLAALDQEHEALFLHVHGR